MVNKHIITSSHQTSQISFSCSFDARFLFKLRDVRDSTDTMAQMSMAESATLFNTNCSSGKIIGVSLINITSSCSSPSLLQAGCNMSGVLPWLLFLHIQFTHCLLFLETALFLGRPQYLTSTRTAHHKILTNNPSLMLSPKYGPPYHSQFKSFQVLRGC